MVKITKMVVAAAEAQKKDYLIWDNELPGFGLRVFSSGKRSTAHRQAWATVARLEVRERYPNFARREVDVLNRARCMGRKRPRRGARRHYLAQELDFTATNGGGKAIALGTCARFNEPLTLGRFHDTHPCWCWLSTSVESGMSSASARAASVEIVGDFMPRSTSEIIDEETPLLLARARISLRWTKQASDGVDHGCQRLAKWRSESGASSRPATGKGYGPGSSHGIWSCRYRRLENLDGDGTLQANGQTGAHHHGTHEVAVYVSKGRSQIRWGEHLEYATEVGPGDFVYFALEVPHQEFNLDPNEAVDFVVVRSEKSGIRVDLDVEPVGHPETVY
jgi:mannose-6-phosphate isomerase-like protein (cupin superfamily)